MISAGTITLKTSEFAQARINRTLLSATGLKGPTVLSVNVLTQQFAALAAAPERISVPLAAATSELVPWDSGASPFFFKRFGSFALQVEATSGAVKRRWLADLRSGSFALPPCDEVTVGVQCLPIITEGAPDYAPIVVTAQVTPGAPSVQATQPWIATLAGSWQLEIGVTTELGFFVRLPDQCIALRAGVSMAGVFEGANMMTDSVQASVKSAATMLGTNSLGRIGMRPEWTPAPVFGDSEWVYFSASNNSGAVASALAYVQYLISP